MSFDMEEFFLWHNRTNRAFASRHYLYLHTNTLTRGWPPIRILWSRIINEKMMILQQPQQKSIELLVIPYVFMIIHIKNLSDEHFYDLLSE